MKKFPMLPAIAAVLLLSTSLSPAIAGQRSPEMQSGRVHVSRLPDILRANNQVDVGLTGNWIDYLETVGGMPFDKESGSQIGVSVSGSLMRDWLVPNLYVYGQLRLSDGHTKYTGSYGSNPYGSLVQTDGAKVTAESARIGKGFALNDAFMLTPYVGVGARQWARELPGPGGLHEDYSHAYWGGGLLVQYSPAARWVVSAHDLVGSTFAAGMKTSDNGGYPVTPHKYDLGSSTIYMAGLSVDYAVTRHLHASLGVEYTNFRYGASEVFNKTYEPDSKTSETTVKVGLGYAF